MKRILFTLYTGILFSLFVSANNADLFTYNFAQVEQEMHQLQLLEDYVYANPGITLTGLQAEECMLISDLKFNNGLLEGFDKKDDDTKDKDDEEGPPLGIPSFLWGFVGGVWGIAIVYFMMEDNKEQIGKSVKGCVVSRLTCCALYVVVYALIIAGYLSVFSSYYYW